MLESWAYSEAFLDLNNASNYVHLDGFNDDGPFQAFAPSSKYVSK